MDAVLASHAGPLRHAPVHFDGRTGLHCHAPAAGCGLHQSGLRTLRRALPETLHLLLGGPAAPGTGLVAGAGEEFALSGFFGTDVLGTRARAAAAQTRRLAAVLADPVIPGDLLRGLSEPALPASD